MKIPGGTVEERLRFKSSVLTRAVQVATKDPRMPAFVVGDFNMTQKQVADLLLSLCHNHRVDFDLVGSAGGPCVCHACKKHLQQLRCSSPCRVCASFRAPYVRYMA